MPQPDYNPITAFVKARLDALACFVREAGELADLPHHFSNGHGGGKRDVEAAAAASHRDEKPRVRRVLDMVWHAGRFTAEEKYIPIRIDEVGVGQGGSGREEEQPASLASPPLLEAVEVDMPVQGRHFEIIHAGAPEIAVGEVEAGGLDDVDCEAEAGGHAQDGAGIAGDVGLVKRDAEGSHETDRDQSCRTATLVRRATTAGLSGWFSLRNAAIAAPLSTRTSGGGYGIHDDRRYPPPHPMGFRLKAESVRRFRHSRKS